MVEFLRAANSEANCYMEKEVRATQHNILSIHAINHQCTLSTQPINTTYQSTLSLTLSTHPLTYLFTHLAPLTLTHPLTHPLTPQEDMSTTWSALPSNAAALAYAASLRDEKQVNHLRTAAYTIPNPDNFLPHLNWHSVTTIILSTPYHPLSTLITLPSTLINSH